MNRHTPPPTPVFVIGKNRSGTKWLSNLLSEHPDIISVRHPDHFGIIETNLLLHMPYIFGDLNYDDNFIAFVQCFSCTDFFKFTGLKKEILYTIKGRDYFLFFQAVMDLYAQKHDKKFWLQKTNPLALKKLATYFPHARFIIIERDIVDNIKSNAGLMIRRRGKKRNLFFEVLLYYVMKKTVKRCFNPRKMIYIRFEELKSNRRETVETLCRHIGVNFSQTLMEDSFQKNTSFHKTAEKEAILTPGETARIKYYAALINLVPSFMFSLAHALKQKLGLVQGNRFIEGTFRSISNHR